MEPIEKKKVEDIIYERLLEKIRSGYWQEGQKLPSENELCASLRVSRASIRGAMQRLKAIGRVTIIQGRGSFVSVPGENYQFTCGIRELKLTRKEFLDIVQLRESVELNALMTLASPDHQADLIRLMEANERMKEAAHRGDEMEYSVQDCLFHLSIINASGNELFIQIARIFQNQYYEYFREMTKLIFHQDRFSGQMRFSAKDDNDGHVQLYRCIYEKRAEEARTRFLKLLSDSHTRFMAYLEENEP